MTPAEHDACAARIEHSLLSLPDEEHELVIEGCMLAAAHRLNAHLHRLGATSTQGDLMHTYLLTINEYRRLAVADAESMKALADIEDLRPAYVRGDHTGGAEAARYALRLLAAIRQKTHLSEPSPQRTHR
jgi:hypothetical protein